MRMGPQSFVTSKNRLPSPPLQDSNRHEHDRESRGAVPIMTTTQMSSDWRESSTAVSSDCMADERCFSTYFQL